MAGRERRPSPGPTARRRTASGSGPRPGAQVQPTTSVSAAPAVAAAGAAIVTTARVGRLLTRTGWGLAKRLPGGRALQREVQRLQDVAVSEARRLFEAQPGGDDAHPEERRVATLIQGDEGTEPLRGAMHELLERSIEDDRTTSRDYLYGNIISQLVPDEARILAAMSDGTPFAALDLVVKPFRGQPRTVLANACSVGRAAGIVVLENVPTYVTRLYRFGLIEFSPPNQSVEMQYDVLATEAVVQAAIATAEARNGGAPKQLRKTATISQFGREFWQACDPSQAGAPAERPQLEAAPARRTDDGSAPQLGSAARSTAPSATTSDGQPAVTPSTNGHTHRPEPRVYDASGYDPSVYDAPVYEPSPHNGPGTDPQTARVPDANPHAPAAPHAQPAPPSRPTGPA